MKLSNIILLIDDTLPHAARQAIAKVLLEEGGINANPIDKGGLTKFGIAQRWYPDLDIANLTIPDAAEIYYLDYWCFNSCNQLPSELAIMLFDCAVNQGGSFARKTLQKLLNVKQDGIIGPKTIAEAKSQIDLLFLTQFTRERCRKYSNIAQADPSQITFIEGWIDRALDVLTDCQITAVFGVGELLSEELAFEEEASEEGAAQE
jgi:lysozyme family protein